MSAEQREEIPPHIPQVVHATIKDTLHRLDTERGYDISVYGHAAGMLAQVAYAQPENKSPDEVLASIRRYAQVLIERHGPDIIDFVMKPELKEALGFVIENSKKENE